MYYIWRYVRKRCRRIQAQRPRNADRGPDIARRTPARMSRFAAFKHLSAFDAVAIQLKLVEALSWTSSGHRQIICSVCCKGASSDGSATYLAYTSVLAIQAMH
eukprot:4007809-Pleurochrysis_carterae.AAC.1